LAYYCSRLGLKMGVYIVFISNAIAVNQDVKEDIEQINKVTIRTYLIEFDEDKDF